MPLPILFRSDCQKLITGVPVSSQCALTVLSSLLIYILLYSLDQTFHFIVDKCIILDPLTVLAGGFSAMLLIFPIDDLSLGMFSAATENPCTGYRDRFFSGNRRSTR